MAPNMAALTAQFENTDMRLIESQYDLAAPYVIKIMDRVCTGLRISTYEFVSNRSDPLKITDEILEQWRIKVLRERRIPRTSTEVPLRYATRARPQWNEEKIGIHWTPNDTAF